MLSVNLSLRTFIINLQVIIYNQDMDDVQISNNQNIFNYKEPDLAEKRISLSKHLDCGARDQMNLESEKLWMQIIYFSNGSKLENLNYNKSDNRVSL